MVQMNENTVNKHLKQLEELLFDEGKIVTYKTLSRIFKVHVNTAKQLMYTFKLQSKGEWQDMISCTYLVCGLKSDGTHVVTVVNENDLTALKDSLTDVTSEHVFSLQKIKQIDNFQALVGVEQFPSDNSISPIKCSESAITVGPVVVKASTSGPVVKKDVKAPLKKPDQAPVAVKPVPVSAPKAESNVAAVEKAGKPASAPTKKTGSISSMFSAQNQKAKPPSVDKKKVEDTSKASTSIKKEENTTTGKAAIEIEVVEDNVISVEAVKGKKEPKKVASGKEKKAPKKKVEKLQDKKRKRIQVLSDSEDSDDDFKRERSPSPEPVPETEAMIIGSDKEDEVASETPAGHKRKKRKIVDKHVMNEDGYMETKKEVVFETDSEPDETPSSAPVHVAKKNTPPAKSPGSPSKKGAKGKPSPPAKKAGKGKSTVTDGKKQTSLMSFFKKS